MDDGNDQVEALTLEPPSTGPRSRRAGALWVALAAVAVVAGAVVVTSADDDEGPPLGLPVALAANAGNGRSAESAADAMLAPVTYVAGDDLPALGGEAPAYRLAGTVTEERVRSLADALSMGGDVTRAGESWTVDDGAAHLEVYEGGGAQWWYTADGGGVAVSGSSSGSGIDSCAEIGIAVRCASGTPSCVPANEPPKCVTAECGDDCVSSTLCDDPASECVLPTTSTECGPGDDCVAPSPVPPVGDPDCPVSSDEPDRCADDTVSPANLPSEADARAIALDLLAATGMDLDDADVQVEGGFDGWYVVVEPRLDGVPSGLSGNVTVGEAGVVTMASGTLGDPEPMGDYPILDTRAAIDRANATAGMDVPVVGSDVGAAASSAASGCAPDADCVDDAGAATTVPPCAAQPDGREICTDPPSGACKNTAAEGAMDEVIVCELPPCPQVVPPADDALEAPDTIDCEVPVPDPGEVPPDAGRLEVVLVDAEPALLVLGAVDGSLDGYLVPAYRFTDADGGTVALPAVANSALTTPPTPATEPVPPPPPDTVIEPQPCDEPIVEADASGTTITVQPDPCVLPEPATLADGEEPVVGVGYYVDVDTTCHEGSFELAGQIWNIDGGSTDGWSTPHEGGMFTLDAVDHGTFVGDADAATKTATFRPRAPEADYICVPAPRS